VFSVIITIYEYETNMPIHDVHALL